MKTPNPLRTSKLLPKDLTEIEPRRYQRIFVELNIDSTFYMVTTDGIIEDYPDKPGLDAGHSGTPWKGLEESQWCTTEATTQGSNEHLVDNKVK